jgi:hypothetical protein
MFTRFHDDPCRIVKQNQQMTGLGRYMLDVPGNGDKPCYMLDPQIIPQKWAGNLYTNSTDLQSSLLGLDRRIGKDCLGKDEYTRTTTKLHSTEIQYPTCTQLTTEQSRVIMPAWTARDLEQVDWYPLILNPQENVTMSFQNNVSTRVLEKDYFVRNVDCPANQSFYSLLPVQTNKISHYTSGPTVCTTSNSCEMINK